MSQQNVEVLRAVYQRWAGGDFWTSEVFDPDIEIVWAADMPDVGTYHGLAGLERSVREWFSAWETVRMKAEEIVDIGDRVLVLLTAYGRGRGSTIETEAKYGHLWTMRGGIATRLEGYLDWDSARTSAGIEE